MRRNGWLGFDRWQQLNRAFIVDTADGPWPEPNTQWMLYQALAGIWPEDIEDIDGVLSDRFKNYAQKAIREAKTYTDWGNQMSATRPRSLTLQARYCAREPSVSQ